VPSVTSPGENGRAAGPTVWRSVSRWALTLHIYVSMAGFLLLFLFSLTGLTLNHGDFGWSEPRLVKRTLLLPQALVDRPSEAALAAYARDTLGIRAPVKSYREYPDEIELLFAGPGSRAQVQVTREDRTARVEIETRGLLAVIGDLHKGRDSGRVWSWVIDFTAVLFMFTALTGMITLASLRARRRTGFLLGALGVVLTLLVYWLWVPR
jgi:uncharacterized protein